MKYSEIWTKIKNRWECQLSLNGGIGNSKIDKAIEHTANCNMESLKSITKE